MRRSRYGRRRGTAPMRGTFVLACIGFMAFTFPIAQRAWPTAGGEASLQWPVPYLNGAGDAGTGSGTVVPKPFARMDMLDLTPRVAVSYEEPTVRVYVTASGRTEEMPLETYVLGVVAGEMPASYEPAALEAQAVAARTFTVDHMVAFGGKGCTKHPGADVCTDSGHCQAFVGEEKRTGNWGAQAEANTGKVWAAVSGTQGQVITYEGKPIEVLYHSSSGGETEDVENVFNESLPYLRSVVSRGEEDAPQYASTKVMGKDAFIALMRKAYPKAVLSKQGLREQVVIGQRTAAGRVEGLKLGNVTAKGTEIRSLLGLNSTNFTISIDDENVTFYVKGYGHGVGMSQVGANSMATNGATYGEILTHYYTGTRIVDLGSLE